MRSSGIVLLADSDPRSNGVVIWRVRIRDRLAARLLADRLDRELAAGVPADSSTRLTLRAHRLLRPVIRRRLCEALRRIVDHADRRPLTPPVLPRDQIVAAGPALTQLAARLADRGPIDVRGVAIAWLLVTDPARFLFARERAATVAMLANEAFEALAPGSAAPQNP